VAILLVLLVLIQNEEGDSLGGIFAGGSGSAFGSRSGNVLTKASSILGGTFLVLSLCLAVLNKGAPVSGVEAAGRHQAVQANEQNSADKTNNATGNWWQENPAKPEAEAPAAKTPAAPATSTTPATKTAPVAPDNAKTGDQAK
jgi:preprotein translocase subunit SecG